MNIQGIRQILTRAEGRRDQLQADTIELSKKLEETREEFQCYDAARIIGTWVSESTREDVRQVFSSIGTSALQAVFGEDSGFDIVFRETEDGKRQAQLIFSAGGVSGDVIRKGGNSAGAVLSTMLRRAMILLDGRLTNTLFADEPLYGIDAGKVSIMAQLDRQLVDNNGLQLVVITHDGEDDYKELADVVIEVRKENGISRVSTTCREETV